MRNEYIFCLSLLVLGATSLPATADIKPSDSAAEMAAARAAAKKEDMNAGSKLRCWQYGELLFEESGITGARLNKELNPLVFEREGSDRGDLLLVELGTATCLYEK